ncbi:hypothetical protein [Streptomyces sp. NPDC049040]|uniref:hypothetical protein n=1 Tax=Streptomyces sp. NPDC049040 TaxID=3365593 RepID=UPI003712A647
MYHPTRTDTMVLIVEGSAESDPAGTLDTYCLTRSRPTVTSGLWQRVSSCGLRADGSV